jgi:hypothetical protein
MNMKPQSIPLESDSKRRAEALRENLRKRKLQLEQREAAKTKDKKKGK